MAKSHKDWNLKCKVYIGNLSETTSRAEVESAFAWYGPLKNVWVARNPPGFAFVEFEDSRDAEDACRGLDGTRIGPSRVRVEMSHGKSRRNGPPGSGRRGDPYPPRDGRDSRDVRDFDRAPKSGRRREEAKPYRRNRSVSRTPSRSPSRSFSRSRSRSPVVRRKGVARHARSISKERRRSPIPGTPPSPVYIRSPRSNRSPRSPRSRP